MSCRFRAALLAASLGFLCAPLGAQTPAPPSAPSIDRLDPGLDAVLAPDTRIERVATGFGFTEGPAWHHGRLWFSDVRDDKLRTMTRDGTVTLVLDNAGGLAGSHPNGASIGPNGLAPAKDGTMLMVQMGARRLARVDDQGKLQPFLSDYQGKRLNSPNDLVYDKDGALWFTDPPFGLFNGMDKDPAKELPFNAVFRYADGRLEPVITDMALPNGIGFSPDFKTLYVANYSRPDMYIRAYDVAPGGRLSAPRVLIRFPASAGPGGADGLKIDTAGNIWATGPGGIRIITPQGKVLGQIKLPEVAANLAFGEDGYSVYITASTSVYRLHTKVKGEIPVYSDMK